MGAVTGYSLALFPQHAKLLADSAIPPELAHARGYVSVDTKKRLDGLSIARDGQNVPGLLIPLLGKDGSTWGYQYRPDTPRITNGRVVKYETPRGQRAGLDVPPGIGPMLDDPKVPLWVTEGSRKADSMAGLDTPCVSLSGVWSWRGTNAVGGRTALPDWADVALNGRTVVLAFDGDVARKPGVRKALTALAGYLTSKGAAVRHLHLPDTDDKTGLDDAIARGYSLPDLLKLVRPDPPGPREAELPEDDQPPGPPPPRPTPEPRPLADVVKTFRRWLHLNDPAPVYAIAGTIVANRAAGDPVWLLIVSAPSTGKTELLSAAAGLPYVRSVATLTASALLSGTGKRERTKDATGGVLRQIGDFGILLAKDFTSVLAQNRDTRAEALAALREVYDGRWDRPVGTDGGRVLTWRGKCGLLGGVTPAFDGYHAVVSTLGDRFLLLRLPDVDPAKTGQMALAHRGRETRMRAELADALAGLVEHADTGKVNRELDEAETARLVALATFTARARTGVARDGYRRDVLYLPQVEGPGRLVTALARLLGGLEAIGCDTDTSWSVLARVALDCVPSTRVSLARVLLDLPPASLHNPRPDPVTTTDIATKVRMATSTAREHLEDLALLGIADRTKTSDAPNAHDRWRPSDWLRQHWPETEEKCTYDPPTPEGGGPPNGQAAATTPPRTSPLYFSDGWPVEEPPPDLDWSDAEVTEP